MQPFKIICLLASDLNGYATESWVNGEGFAGETWVENQGYAHWIQSVQANTQSINQNTAFISNNTGTISNFNTRLLVIENGYVQSTDLVNYATQSWVLARGYGLQSDVLANTQTIAAHDTTLFEHNGRLILAETAISDLESDYLSSSVLNTLVTNADLSNAEYITQSDIDGLSDQISQNTTDILACRALYKRYRPTTSVKMTSLDWLPKTG